VGIVTLTTVGYGDIVPHTTAGRFAGIVIMITGIAVLGVLAGSLASLFNLSESSENDRAQRPAPTGAAAPAAIQAELTALEAQLRAAEDRVGKLAELIGARRSDAG
jgi:voltage-gated potassium channel